MGLFPYPWWNHRCYLYSSYYIIKNLLSNSSPKEKRGQALRKLVTLFSFVPSVPLLMGHIGVFGQSLKNRL